MGVGVYFQRRHVGTVSIGVYFEGRHVILMQYWESFVGVILVCWIVISPFYITNLAIVFRDVADILVGIPEC